MNEEAEILKLVCHRLETQKIAYMVTGSIAANFYAVPRMTRDVDIVVDLSPADAQRIFDLFQSDFYADLEIIRSEIARRGMFNIIHFDYALKVDFIVRKHSEFRELEFSRRRTISLDGGPITITSIEDLILSKLFWARGNLSELQLGDVRKLLQATGEIDQNYLQTWITKLELGDVYAKVSG